MRGMSARRGSALLIVLGMVAFMVVSAVGFSVFMRNNRIPSSYLRRSTASRQLAKAALANAMSDIDNAINENPYPGLGGLSVSGNNDNIWYGRVLCKREGGNLPESSATVSTLTLEGLAYLPPAIINDVRYFSRRTPTAQWSRLDYDAGRCAYCIVDVSDFFDLNSVRADRPRGSGTDNLISLAYLFETGTSRAWGEVKPFDFQNKLDGIVNGDGMPLVSMADYNLVLKRMGIGGLPSPFCEAIENGGNVYGTSPLPEGNSRWDSWDYLKYAIQRFVTDVQPGRSREEWFDEKDSNPFHLSPEDTDLSTNQPFPNLMSSDSETENDSTIAQVLGQVNDDILSPTYHTGEIVALYDYLDQDSVPLSVAFPTAERTPMIVGVEIDSDSSLKVEVKKDESEGNSSEVGGYVITKKTVVFYPKFTGNIRVNAGFAFPFKYRGELNDEAGEFRAETVGYLHAIPKDKTAEPGNEERGCRTSIDGALKEWPRKGEGNKLVKEGLLALISEEKKTALPSDDVRTQKDAVSKSGGGGLHDVQMPFPDIAEDAFKETYIAKFFLRKRERRQDGVLIPAPEGEHVNGWEIDNEENGGKPEIKLKALADFKGGVMESLKTGDAEYVWGISLAVRLRNKDEKLVDMAPAHVNDDDSTPSGNVKSRLGSIRRPVLRFDDRGDAAAFSVKEGIEGYKALEALVAGGVKTIECQRTYLTDDPRYNYAAENWYPAAAPSGSLGEAWLEHVSCKNPVGGGNGQDHDIFMSVSNQGYLQDAGEIAMLPRVNQLKPTGDGWKNLRIESGRIPTGCEDMANAGQMWRTYGCFGDLDEEYEVDNLRLVSPVYGYRVNPYTKDDLIKLAPFVNTPYDWWAAGTNRTDSVKRAMMKADGSMDESGTALLYTFGARGDEAKVPHERVQELANRVSESLRSGNGHWYRTWQELQWPSDGANSEKICGVDFGIPLHGIDRKYLCSYWRKCYSNAQQLFLVFFRSEPVVIGGGAGDGKAPPQLGARGVAVVWRDPNTPKGESGSTSSNRRPHAMRVLFYHQFD